VGVLTVGDRRWALWALASHPRLDRPQALGQYLRSTVRRLLDCGIPLRISRHDDPDDLHDTLLSRLEAVAYALEYKLPREDPRAYQAVLALDLADQPELWPSLVRALGPRTAYQCRDLLRRDQEPWGPASRALGVLPNQARELADRGWQMMAEWITDDGEAAA